MQNIIKSKIVYSRTKQPLYFLLLFTALALAGCSNQKQTKKSFWIDTIIGEPVCQNELIQDLSGVDVIYLGEKHTLQSHHDLQAMIVDELGQKERHLVIGFEMLEDSQQESLDRYAAGEITFDQFAGIINWSDIWNNYEQYREIFENGRKHNAKLLGLNANRKIIRKIGRAGFDSLNEDEKQKLPPEICFDDPTYKAHLQKIMKVMPAATPDRIEYMMQAQVVRDETMASNLAKYLKNPTDSISPENSNNQKPIAIVICGSGHVNYGMATAQRLHRRLPQLEERIIVMSESNQLKLDSSEKMNDRMMKTKRKSLRQTQSPIADYLYVTQLH